MTNQLDAADLAFLIANFGVGDTPPAGTDPLAPIGIRAIDGTQNNISGLNVVDQYNNFVATTTFGVTEQPFINLSDGTETAIDLGNGASTTSGLTWDPTANGGTGGLVKVSDMYAPGNVVFDAAPRIISNLISDQTSGNPAVASADLLNPGDPTIDKLPYSSLFTFIGQFFDHGLDFVRKDGDGAVMIDILPGDTMYGGTIPGFPFMPLSRATQPDGSTINTTAPFVEQSQTYGSTAATTFYLKEYDANGEMTGDLVHGAGGGMATWADIKANANTWARAQTGANADTVMLTDANLLDIPDPTMWNPTANGGAGAFEGDFLTGQAFIADIAHNAVPVFNAAGQLEPDANDVIDPNGSDAQGNQSPPITNPNPDFPADPLADPTIPAYDDELLNAHFVAGDPRVNENVALTAIHETFHNEHSRILAEIKDWVAQQEELLPGTTGEWTPEALFQATKLVNEMQYQHMIFEEFGRRMSPNIDAFGAYDVTVNPNITAEFAHAVYRLGHSMLTDTVKATDTAGNTTDLSLVDAFLDPEMYNQFGGADFLKGSQLEQGAQIDEFVVDSLRNFLVGLPLDLAALNIARGRETGLATLNDTRADLFAQTGEASLTPYTSWADFGSHLLNPASLVNFIAAYSRDTDIIAARTGTSLNSMSEARALAASKMLDATFMDNPNNTGDLGFWDIDLWIGGLAEEKVPLGMLGSTFDFVFAQQMIALQNGDRFYYLGRLGGNLLAQIEGQTFTDLMMRGTGATHMNGDAFGFADAIIEIGAGDGQNADGSFSATDRVLSPQAATAVNHEIIGGTNAANKIDGGAGNDTLWGDGGNDTLNGGTGDDHVYGGDGNDIIQGGIGFDFLRGDDGDDVIRGGMDDDLMFGNNGNDIMYGDQGFDTLLGDAGNDELHGGAQDDALEAGEGDDILFGDSGDDLLVGDAGNDVLIGGTGDDRMDGGEGDNLFIGGAGADAMNGALGGYDIASYETWLRGVPLGGLTPTGLVINLTDPALSTGDAMGDIWLGIEEIRGSDYADMITGDLLGNILVGGGGNDTITGVGGNDVLVGSEGNDRINATAGDTVLFRGSINDFAFGNATGFPGSQNFFTVTDTNLADGNEGTDTISNAITWLQFDDALLNNQTGLYSGLVNLVHSQERTQFNGSYDAMGNKQFTNVLGEVENTIAFNDGVTVPGGNGVFVSDIEVFDPDGANNGARLLGLAGVDAGSFDIHTVNGVDKLFFIGGGVGSKTNYEVKPFYNVTVTLSENAVVASSINFTMNITDQNDNAPVFTSGGRVNVLADVASDVILYRAETEDRDTTGEQITYTLGGADASSFELVNGELRKMAGATLENRIYNVTIDATDGMNAALAPKSLAIHVGAPATPPPPTTVAPVVFALDAARNIDLGQALLDGVILDADVESWNPDQTGFGNGQLVVSIAGGTAQDDLSVAASSGAITSDGVNVFYNGVNFGSISGGAAGSDLTVDLAGNANSASVTALARAITYSNSLGADVAAREITFQVTDADGDVGSDSISVSIGGTPPPPTTVAPVVFALDEIRIIDSVQAGSGVILDADVQSWNPDQTGFGNGQLVVSIAGGTAEDNLSVAASSGAITSDGANVFYNGNNFGSISGGAGGADLAVDLAGNANSASLTALLQAITFSNSLGTEVVARDITFEVTDADNDIGSAIMNLEIGLPLIV